MSADKGLFGDDMSVKNISKIAEYKWKFVTNEMNLAIMLGSGLIMPPSGFGNKYYQDTLQWVPGWVPLFPNQIQKQVFDYSAEEMPKTRAACFLELDLKELSCTAWRYNGEIWQQIQFPEGLDGTEELLLLPAPLPLSLINERVYFVDSKQANSFKRSLSDFGNLTLEPFKTGTRKAEFNKKGNFSWPVIVNNETGPQPRDVNLAAVNAIGGAVTALAILSQSNRAAKEAYQVIAERFTASEERQSAISSLIGIVSDWAYAGGNKASENDPFVLLVQCLYEHAGAGEYASFIDIILVNFTEITAKAFPNKPDALTLANELTELLQTTAQSPRDTPINLLRKHEKPLQQVLLGFVFRQTLSEFLHSPLPLELQPERAAAVALLAGLQEGWQALESHHKQQQNCHLFVPNVMATLAHRFAKTDMQLPKVEAPLLLSEHFEGEKWTARQNNAAVYLAKKSKWKCISTRIRLGHGNHEFVIGSGGAEIILEGEVKVSPEVDKEKFYAGFKSLQCLESEVATKLRDILGGK